jgi:DNA-binding transcriptional ArsR family regulator
VSRERFPGFRSLGLAMITLLGLRQQQLLTLLLENKEGLTVEELSEGLGITDNAVRQHLTALERDGMVVKGETQSTGATLRPYGCGARVISAPLFLVCRTAY